MPVCGPGSRSGSALPGQTDFGGGEREGRGGEALYLFLHVSIFRYFSIYLFICGSLLASSLAFGYLATGDLSQLQAEPVAKEDRDQDITGLKTKMVSDLFLR